MPTYRDFFFGTNIAILEEAIGEVLQSLENQREGLIRATYLSTGLLSDIRDRFGVLVDTRVSRQWTAEVFREHLQEAIQAYMMFSSTKAGIKNLVAATTQIPPVLKPIRLLNKWILDKQWLPNIHFSEMDAFLIAENRAPYTISEGQNLLYITINGQVTQLARFPIGVLTARQVIDFLNDTLVGARTYPYGHDRFVIRTLEYTTEGSLKVEPQSSVSSILGLDIYLRGNAPAPVGLTGTMPFGWRIQGPDGVDSNPRSYEGAIFGSGAAYLKGNVNGPFYGLLRSVFLKNGGFENQFEDWDKTEGPDFFITTSTPHTGNRSLAVITRRDSNGRAIVNRLKSVPKPMPVPGSVLHIEGYQKARGSSLILTSPVIPPATYRWTVANAVQGFVQAQDSGNTPDTFGSPTCVLNDPSIDFIAAGVIPGMALQVTSSGRTYVGVVVNVNIHDIYIDGWRTKVGQDLFGFEAPPISGLASAITDNSLVDTLQNFPALGVQTGPTYATRDKVRVDETLTALGAIVSQEQAVRDITAIPGPDTLEIISWGGIPVPPAGVTYYVYTRPVDGSPYQIFRSLTESTIFSPTTEVVSAKFRYKIRFLDRNGVVVGEDNAGDNRGGGDSPVDVYQERPLPGNPYQFFNFHATVPVGAESAELLIDVSPDDVGVGAIAQIDDIKWISDTDIASELHVAVDGEIKKIQFKDSATALGFASGTVTYIAKPLDGSWVTVGSDTFEFDYGDVATGYINYTGQPADGDTITIGTVTIEFDSDNNVTPGNIPITIAGTTDDLWAAFSLTANSFVPDVHLEHEPEANKIAVIASTPGVLGNTIVFTSVGVNFTLTGVGFLAGATGTGSGVVSGHIPVPIAATADLTYTNLVNLVTSTSAVVGASINTTLGIVTITALSPGANGNLIVFTSFNGSPAFTISPALTGRLSGGASSRAIGTLDYTILPTDGDQVVLGTSLYEFDDNGVVCPGATAIAIQATPVESYDLLAQYANGAGGVKVLNDGPNLRLSVESLVEGVSGNDLPFRKKFLSGTLLNPTNGDLDPQTVSATNSASEVWYGALGTFFVSSGAIVQPAPVLLGTNYSTATPISISISVANAVPVGSSVFVCATTRAIVATPVVTDTKGNTYVVSVNNVDKTWIFQSIITSALDVADTITLDGSPNTFTGVSVSAFSVSNICDLADQTTTATDTGAVMTLGPTAGLSTSGEISLAVYGIQGDDTDVFTPATDYTTIGVVAVPNAANEVSLYPTFRFLDSGHLIGAAASSFADPNALTAAEVASFINTYPGVAGKFLATNEYTPDFPNGRIVLTSLNAGLNSAIAIGGGTAAQILGFQNSFGVLKDADDIKPSWRVTQGPNPGDIILESKAFHQAAEFYGTSWHFRFWAKTSGAAVGCQAAIIFDGNPPETGSTVLLTSEPQPVEVFFSDEQHFTSIKVQIVITNAQDEDTIDISDPFLIDETSKCFHLASHTIPRNKQRAYRTTRMAIAGHLDPTETGLVGLSSQVENESLSLIGNDFTDVGQDNLFPKSDIVSRAGVPSFGTITHVAQPAEGDIVVVGSQVFEFDTDISVGVGHIAVPIGGTMEDTFMNLAAIIDISSLDASAVHDPVHNRCTVTARVVGTSGNGIVFGTDSASVSITPLTGFLGGGVDPVTYVRDVDYIIRPDTGEIARTLRSSIPDPSPADLVVSYTYFPAGVALNESYPQHIKQVGEKLEPSNTCIFFFHGTEQDFTDGTKINLSVVPRDPDEFSHLIPTVRGKYAQVISLAGLSGTLDYVANTSLSAILLKDGVSVPRVGGIDINGNPIPGWDFTSDTTIAIDPLAFGSGGVFEIEYYVMFHYTSPIINVDDDVTAFALLPYSYRVFKIVEEKADVSVSLAFNEFLQAPLKLPAIEDQSLAEMTRTLGGRSEILQDSDWSFIDNKTVSLSNFAFSDAAIYTLTYKSSEISYVTPITEEWEVRTSPDGMIFSPWAPFIPGDVRDLDLYAQFRVTISGDFLENEYRLRAISGVGDINAVNFAGFGLTPFGRYPFGDPLDCVEVPSNQPPVTDLTSVGVGGVLTFHGEAEAPAVPLLTGQLSITGGIGPVEAFQSGVFVARGAGATLGTATTTNQYMDFSGVVQDTIIEAQIAIPTPAIFQKVIAQLSSSSLPTVGTSVTYSFSVNGNDQSYVGFTVARASAPTATLIATGTGNIENGSHAYLVTFTIDDWDTYPGGHSGSVTVDGTHKQVSLTNIPLGPSGTTARKIYRTTAGASSATDTNYKLLTVINDNVTTTYTDNISDASLGIAVPLTTTAGSTYMTGISVAAGDLIAIHAKDFVGAISASAGIQSISYLYQTTTTDGFFYTVGAIMISNFTKNNLFQRGQTGGAATNVSAWSPKAIRLLNGTIAAQAAPGVGKSYTYQVQTNNSTPANTGSPVTLSDTNTNVLASINTTLPATITAAAADAFFTAVSSSGAPAATNYHGAVSYLVDGGDGDIQLFWTGRPDFNHSSSVAPGTFCPIHGFATNGTFLSTEAAAATRWPVDGRFKYFAMRATSGTGVSPDTVTVTLFVNGAPTALVLTANSGTASWYSDLLTEVVINEGDLVSLNVIRTAGTNSQFVMNAVIGFSVS